MCGSKAECDFALVINLSFYRFGIPSCQATNHKQTLKDATQDDINVHFGFPGNTNWFATDYRDSFILPLL